MEQEIEVWRYDQMVYAKPRICPGERDIQTPLRFLNTNGSPNLGQTTTPSDSKKKKRENLLNWGISCPDWP